MDYDDVNELVSFDEDTNEVSAMVIIIKDGIVECAEEFELILYNDEERVLLFNDSATVHIADSDSMCMFLVILITLKFILYRCYIGISGN